MQNYSRPIPYKRQDLSNAKTILIATPLERLVEKNVQSRHYQLAISELNSGTVSMTVLN